MQISERQAKTILSPQSGGFLVDGEFPFTHALSPYTGCAFGNTTCGMYCYAPFLPSWTYRPPNMKTFAWGEAVEVKENAADLLANELGRLKPERRQLLREFCSATTDPYQPIEKERRITQLLLRVFTQYKDLDLLVVQTRSRTARSAYGQAVEDWDDEAPAGELYEALVEAGVTVGWSSEGFCGIPYRNEAARIAAEEREQIGSGQTSMFSQNIAKPIAAPGDAIVLHF